MEGIHQVRMANASNYNSKHSQTFLFPAPAVAVEQLILNTWRVRISEYIATQDKL